MLKNSKKFANRTVIPYLCAVKLSAMVATNEKLIQAIETKRKGLLGKALSSEHTLDKKEYISIAEWLLNFPNVRVQHSKENKFVQVVIGF